jgi:hypothetical protein
MLVWRKQKASQKAGKITRRMGIKTKKMTRQLGCVVNSGDVDCTEAPDANLGQEQNVNGSGILAACAG